MKTLPIHTHAQSTHDTTSHPSQKTKSFAEHMKNKKDTSSDQKKKKNIHKEEPLPSPYVPFFLKTTMTALSEIDMTSAAIHYLVTELEGELKHQEHKGISTTTISLGDNAPSELKGVQIEIKHYDTAPHSFQIHFFGPEQAMDFYDKQLANLSSLLAIGLPEYVVELTPPRTRLLSKTEKERKSPMKTSLIIDDEKKVIY